MAESEGKNRDSRAGFDPTATVALPGGAKAAQAVPVLDDLGGIQAEVVGGPMDGLRASTSGETLHVGRSGGNELTLALDPMVSARHCRIAREGQHFWLEDLASRNGTWLGDRQVAGRSLIGPGTSFTVGRTLVEFQPR